LRSTRLAAAERRIFAALARADRLNFRRGARSLIVDALHLGSRRASSCNLVGAEFTRVNFMLSLAPCEPRARAVKLWLLNFMSPNFAPLKQPLQIL